MDYTRPTSHINDTSNEQLLLLQSTGNIDQQPPRLTSPVISPSVEMDFEDLEVITPYGLDQLSQSAPVSQPAFVSLPTDTPVLDKPVAAVPSISIQHDMLNPPTLNASQVPDRSTLPITSMSLPYDIQAKSTGAVNSNASGSILDSLIDTARVERENAINFIKLDEYLEGVVNNKKPSLVPVEKEEQVKVPFEQQNVFNIHPLTMEDIMTDGTREKFELYRSYYFICYCAFDQDPDSISFMQSFNAYILVYSNFVLSFHFYDLESVPAVIRRLDRLKSYLKITPHWINYALLDDITDKYLPLIHSIELEVESIDDLVLIISQTERADMLRRIANARKKVTNLQRLLVAKSDVVRVLMKRLEGIANGSVSSAVSESNSSTLRDTILYLGDVQDHVITMVQTLSHVDNTLGRCHSNYLAQINIELTTSSNDANDAVAKLTALAAILVPLNIITGLWGMNVRIPGQTHGLDTESFGWFIGIICTMVIIVLTGLFGLKFAGLLSAKNHENGKARKGNFKND